MKSIHSTKEFKHFVTGFICDVSFQATVFVLAFSFDKLCMQQDIPAQISEKIGNCVQIHALIF